MAFFPTSTIAKGGSIPHIADYARVSGNAENLYNKATGLADKSTDYGSQTMAAAQGLNTAANNTLQNVVGAETPMMNNVNAVANQNLGTYSNIFAPLQAQQAAEAKNYTSGENIDRLRGRAVADSNASLEAQRRNHAAALASEGVDPATIGAGALDRQAGIAGAAQNSAAANSSYLDTMNTGRQLTQQANQFGLQVGNAGNAGAAEGAGIGQGIVGAQTSSDTGQVNNLAGASTYLNDANNALGTGISANTSEANIQHTGFADQLARSHEKDLAQKMQSDSANKWVSTFMEAGGRVPDTGIADPTISFLGDSNAPQQGQSGGGQNAGGIAKMAGMARGGPITNRGALPFSPMPGSTDTVPVMATPGEFMIPKDVVDHKGNEFFHKLIDSTRLKMNERRAIPQQVYAHKSNH